MKTITLTIPENAKITVDGVEWPTSTEVKLWTPTINHRKVSVLGEEGGIIECTFSPLFQPELEAGNIRPTREYAEALDRKRREESTIFRYFYERGIDTRWKEGVKQCGVNYVSKSFTIVYLTETCNGSPFYVESEAIAEQAIIDIPDAIRTVLMGGWV